MRSMVRGFIASVLVGAVLVAGGGIASAHDVTLDDELREVVAAAQTRVVDPTARSVTTTDSRAGTYTISLPGELTTTTPVDTQNVPDGLFKGSGAPLFTTRLPGAFVSAYDTGLGTQSIITIENASAPKDYRFRIDIPAQSIASVQPDGTVKVREGDRVLGGFTAPWAYDANGNTVATSYRIDGNDLVQNIEHDPGTAYPIVADPGDFFGWLRCGASVGMLVAGNMLIATKITKLGGIPRVIKMLQDTRNAEQRWGTLISIFGEYAGISDVLNHCK